VFRLKNQQMLEKLFVGELCFFGFFRFLVEIFLFFVTFRFELFFCIFIHFCFGIFLFFILCVANCGMSVVVEV